MQCQLFGRDKEKLRISAGLRFAPKASTPGRQVSINDFSCSTGYNPVNTSDMKTAVSIPDRVYKAAERTAKRMGVSRSRLYTMAIEKLLATERQRGVTESLNEVYKTEDSSIDPVLMAMQLASLPPDEGW